MSGFSHYGDSLIDGRPSAVRRALGYDDSYGSSSSAGQPLTPTPTPWLVRFVSPSDGLDAADGISQKRKRDAQAASDADASESTPCPVRSLPPAVPCSTAQADGMAQKKRRVDDNADLTDLLQPVAGTRSTNSQLGGGHRTSITRSYSDPATHFRLPSWVYQPVFHHALLTDGTNLGKGKAWRLRRASSD